MRWSQAAERVEGFTLGTRLTRVTRALSGIGTAIRRWRSHRGWWRTGTAAPGSARRWRCFCSVPRFASHARGALVIVVSDGLERGGPERDGRSRMEKLSRAGLVGALALAAGRRSRPIGPRRPRCRRSCPMLDRLGDGSTPQAIAAEILEFSKEHAGMIDARSSHLAAGRSAVADRPDATAHLRSLRGDPAGLSDDGIPGRHRRHRALTKSVYVQANWAPNWRRTRSPGSDPGRRDRLAGRTASSAMPTSPFRMCARPSTG